MEFRNTDFVGDALSVNRTDEASPTKSMLHKKPKNRKVEYLKMIAYFPVLSLNYICS